MPQEYYGGRYAHITGMTVKTKHVHIPSVGESRTLPISLSLPEGLAENAQEYFTKYYIEQPDKYRNCHIGAAAIKNALDLDWVDALGEANEVMLKGRRIRPAELAIGRIGVIGGWHSGEAFAFHSLVGVAPGLGLQTDSERGPLSLLSHEHNVAYYRTRQFEGMDLYT